jgi:hypothetical protein
MAMKKPAFPNRPCPKCQKPIHIKSKKHEECGWGMDGNAETQVKAKKQKAMQVSNSTANGENVSAYFKPILLENPSLLKGKSNQELLNRWLADHPGEKEVPNRIKAILSNLKSVLRKKLRKKPGRKKAEEQVVETVMVLEPAEPVDAAEVALESLEEQIDDCMSVAKSLDREGLDEVIRLLRRARNAVVWKLGQ